MAWHLKPDALGALRDTLLERGAPSSRSSGAAPGNHSAETEALLLRMAPFLELLYLMMVADGIAEDSERRLLQGVSRTFFAGDVSSAALDELLNGFEASRQAEGLEGRLESVANSLSADRLDAEAAFTLTAVMALADGATDLTEHDLLSQLAQMLGVSSRRAHELLEQSPLSARKRPAP